jgi:Type I restriction-modification system methyltransferase subunit
MTSTVPTELIVNKIVFLRSEKVLLDYDLAKLYGVETKVLKQAVRRNIKRFPDDFMFKLTKEENQSLRSQNVTLKRGQHSKYLPFAFTEQGVAMLSSVLNSKRAIDVNIAIMRAFVQLRKMIASNNKLARKLAELEQHLEGHDEQIQAIFEAIQQLMTPPAKPRKKIGFEVKEKQAAYSCRCPKRKRLTMLDNGTKKRIDSARDILMGKVPDPKSQVEQITIAMIYKFMDDMDNQTEELGGKATFFAGEFKPYAWSRLLDRRLSGHERLLLYAEGIEKMNMNENIPQLFRDIFKGAFLPYRNPETLNLFLKEINGFAYDHSERLGDAFEYLLSVLSSQGDAGQFRTPRHIIDFMVEIVNPAKEDTVLDPACGTAGFLISSYKHILRQNTKTKEGDLLTADDKGRLMTNFCGYDISPDMVRLSLVNMYLHSFANPSIYEYDTLTSEDRWGERYDVILANPPFMSPKGGIRPHSRFTITAKRSEVLFPIDTTYYVRLKNESTTNLKFLFSILKNVKLTDLRGGGAVPGLNRNDVYQAIKLPRPPLEVQEKIVAELDGYQKIIDGAKQVVKNYKPAIKIDPDWPMVELGEVAGINEASKDPVKSYGQNEFVYIDIASIENGSGNVSLSNKQKGVDAPSRAKRKVKKGDILLSTVRPNLQAFGYLEEVPENAIASTGFAVLTPSPNKVIGKYIYFMLFENIVLDQMIDKMGKGAYPSINQKDVFHLKFPLPPLEAQQKIVAEIETERELVDANKKLIEIFEKKIKDKIGEVWGE